GAWNIESRTLPPPAAASDQLRNSLANSPAPNPASRLLVPQTNEQWEMMIASADAEYSGGMSLEMLEQMNAVSIEKDTIAGVPVYHVMPSEVAPENQERLFLHVHGGGYILEGGDNAVLEAVMVTAASGIPSISVDYRMPPAHPAPAAVNDTIAVYREVLENYAPEQVALGGTSAGGGLTLASVLEMKELGLSLPGALYLGTPWADLTNASDSLYTLAGIDRILVTPEGFLTAAAELYAGERGVDDTMISPLLGDFSGFPPTVLITGTRDLLLSDTARVHRKLRDEDIVAELHVYEGLSHAGYMIEYGSPESLSAFAEISAFLNTHLE
ncbi:MAG: alpha/beta hydrolase, partial [Gammaproteobacteria bacterium]|nr:alpha/beta hydrolase [Gammaproteobacteria bacterium]